MWASAGGPLPAPSAPAQVRQAAPQVRQRLRLRTVGPEGAGQPGALHLLPGAQGEQGEQPLALAGAEGGSGWPSRHTSNGPNSRMTSGGPARPERVTVTGWPSKKCIRQIVLYLMTLFLIFW